MNGRRGRASVALAAALTVVFVGVVLLLAGHPIGFLWACGVAAFLLAPEAMDRFTPRLKPRPDDQTIAPAWFYLAAIAAMSLLAGFFPLAWHLNESREYNTSNRSIRFQNDPFDIAFTGALSVGGAVMAVVLAVIWFRDARRARRVRRSPRRDLVGRIDTPTPPLPVPPSVPTPPPAAKRSAIGPRRLARRLDR